MKIQIKNRFSGSVIFETDAETIGDAVKAAIIASADLSSADLSFANLRSANLRSADLSFANLSSADLSFANLSSAHLSFADLRSADLSSADLSFANLRSAHLSSANLRSANLSSADLSSANLSFANLSSAHLSDLKISPEEFNKIVSQRTILPEGDIIGWKKLQDGIICKLLIPSDAKRIGGLIGRKCRAEFAKVLEGEGVSLHDSYFTYKVGETVRPKEFNESPLEECAGEIHFFITRQEAEDYN